MAGDSNYALMSLDFSFETLVFCTNNSLISSMPGLSWFGLCSVYVDYVVKNYRYNNISVLLTFPSSKDKYLLMSRAGQTLVKNMILKLD